MIIGCHRVPACEATTCCSFFIITRGQDGYLTFTGVQKLRISLRWLSLSTPTVDHASPAGQLSGRVKMKPHHLSPVAQQGYLANTTYQLTSRCICARRAQNIGSSIDTVNLNSGILWAAGRRAAHRATGYSVQYLRVKCHN